MYRKNSNTAKGRSSRLRCCAVEQLETRKLLSTSILLSDINSSGIGTSSLPEQFRAVGSQVLFLAYSPSNGQMLWSTQGTPQTTRMIKDINPNPQSGAFVGFGGDSIVINGEYYFTGADADHGVELWKSDGTADGTQIVADLVPGTTGSYPEGFTNFNGKLAFEANGSLYISDGSAGGTVNLGAYSPLGNGGPLDRMAVLGSNLYFFRYGASSPDGHNTGELWSTDGTPGGTQMVVDLSPGNDGQDGVNSVPSGLINVGGELYFAGDDGTHGWELWQSDGTAGHTKMVADLAPPPDPSMTVIDGSYPSNLTNVNGTLYFAAAPVAGPTELYRLDPTTSQPLLVDPISNGGPSSPQNFTASGNLLYFTASDSAHGNELWRSDGTAAGTYMVKDINPGTADSSIVNIINVSGKLFFSANDGTDGAELWTSDGTSGGTVMVEDTDPGSNGSNPGPFLSFHGELIFAAGTDDLGREPRALLLQPPAAPTAKLAVSGARGTSNSKQPTIFGTAPAGSTVYLFADNVQVGSTTAASDGTYRVSSSIPLKDGTHMLGASDVFGGQTSKLSAPMTVHVDTTPPTVKVTSTAGNAIDVKFSEAVNFGRGGFSITNLGKGQRIDPADIRVTYNAKKNTAQIVFRNLKGGSLSKGHYRIRFSPATTDTAGNGLTAASFGFTVSKARA